MPAAAINLSRVVCLGIGELGYGTDCHAPKLGPSPAPSDGPSGASDVDVRRGDGVLHATRTGESSV